MTRRVFIGACAIILSATSLWAAIEGEQEIEKALNALYSIRARTDKIEYAHYFRLLNTAKTALSDLDKSHPQMGEVSSLEGIPDQDLRKRADTLLLMSSIRHALNYYRLAGQAWESEMEFIRGRNTQGARKAERLRNDAWLDAASSLDNAYAAFARIRK